MLVQLRVKNFRLLRDVEVDLGDLTVFIGPNSSGKSTVLEVIDFLGRCAADGLQSALTAHGGFDSIHTVGAQESLVLGSQWGFVSDVGTPRERSWRLDWEIEIERAHNGAALVKRESLIDGDSNPVRTIVGTTPDGKRQVHADKAKDGEQPATVDGPGKLAFEAVRDSNRYPELEYLRALVANLRVLGSLVASPPWARPNVVGPSARDSLVLAPVQYVERQGIGLANALYNLSVDHGAIWSDLERAFRAEFPFVRRIVFPPDPGGSKVAFAIEDTRFPGRKIYASEMSDGMVSYLILLASVMHPEQIAVLGLDEPDATVHPSALRRLLEIAQRPHTKRSLVVVTHSNALLDELNDPAAQIRVVDGTSEGAVIRKLDPVALSAWRERYSLSDLRQKGQVDDANSAYGLKEPPIEAKPETKVAPPIRTRLAPKSRTSANLRKGKTPKPRAKTS